MVYYTICHAIFSCGRSDARKRVLKVFWHISFKQRFCARGASQHTVVHCILYSIQHIKLCVYNRTSDLSMRSCVAHEMFCI